MSQPTQDTDITSSLAPQIHLRGEVSEKNMTLKQGGTMESPTMELECTNNVKCEGEERSVCVDLETAKSLEEIFPWLVKFSKVMRSSVGSKSYQFLERLLSVYIENVLKDVNACYTKPYRAARLKNHIRDTLTFFHLYWREIKERVDDHNLYLNKMSEIIGMYMDMELKASRRGKDSSVKIATKLLTAMYIYLDNSEEHMFRVLFRAKLIMKNYSEICEPIFTKFFTHLLSNPASTTDVMYVRYLLALKLWRKVKDDPLDKKKINQLAVAKLGPWVPSMAPELTKIVPKPPKSHKNGTMWLMQPNSFDLKKACDNFVKYELKEHTFSIPEELGTLKVMDNVEMASTQINMECMGKSPKQRDSFNQKSVEIQSQPKTEHQSDKTAETEISRDRPSPVKKIVKLKKFKPAFPKLKPGEVVLIDLTVEDEENKEADGRKKKKKKEKKKLEWLKGVKKRPKVKREANISENANWVEIADAHSTENWEDSWDEVAVEHKPISEDKVSESTKDYAVQEIQRFSNRPRRITTLSKQMRTFNGAVTVKEERRGTCDAICGFCEICTAHAEQNYMMERHSQFTHQDVRKSTIPTDIPSTMKQDSEEDFVSSQSSPLKENAMVLINYMDVDVKNELFSQEENSPEAVPMVCQDCNVSSEMIKEEPQDTTEYSTTDRVAISHKNVVADSCSPDHSLENYEQRKERSVSVETIKQDPRDNMKDSTIDNIAISYKNIITHSHSLKNSMDMERIKERNVEKIRRERQNTLDDSTTDMVSICDKHVSISGPSSLDNHMETIERVSKCNMSIEKRKQKLQDIMDSATETCVVSTTVSADRSSESCPTETFLKTCPEAHSHVTSVTMNRMPISYRTQRISELCKQGEILDKRKLKSRGLISESSKRQSVQPSYDMPVPLSNDKLQQSLIHALSLDTMMQMETDYSKSELEEGDNRHFSDGGKTKSFARHTNARVDAQKSAGSSKNRIDEFENIDILDSILNGDMSMQDEQEILEEPQSSMLPSICHDTSASVLNFITEFFSQPETQSSYKRDCLPDCISDSEISTKSLPEGSLGTTGILNSLLDSDLASVDSPPSDFMYSNVQTVDPRLIRKSPRDERSFFMNDFSSVSELFLQKDKPFISGINPHDAMPKKTKDQLFLDQKDSFNSTVDLVEFGLNANKPATFEMPVLEEEMIQLPQHTLIEEPNATLIIPSSCESPLSTHSDVVNADSTRPTLSSCITASPTHEFNTIHLPEGSYVYPKMDNMKEFESLNELMNPPSNEIDTTEDLPTSLLIDFTPPQSVDPPPSPYTFTSSPAPLHNPVTPSSPTASSVISRKPMPTNILTSPPSMLPMPARHNLTPPPTPQHGQTLQIASQLQQQRLAAVTNQSVLKRVSIDHNQISSSSFVLSMQDQQKAQTARSAQQAGITKVTTPAKISDRSRRTSKGKARSTKQVVTEIDLTDPEQSEVHLAHLQVTLTRLTQPEMSTQPVVQSNSKEQSTQLHSIQHQEETRPQSTQSVHRSQLQHIDLRRFNVAAEQNKQVLINLNGKTTPAIVFERNPQNGKLLQTLQEDMSNHNNVLYKVTSAINTSTARNKPYSKLPKVNVTIQNDTEVPSNPQVTNTRSRFTIEPSQEVERTPRTRLSTRNIKAQALKSTKEKNVRKTVPFGKSVEEPSAKKRKVTSNLLPLLKNEGLIFAMNQPKTQEKHQSKIIRRDFSRKEKTKRTVV